MFDNQPKQLEELLFRSHTHAHESQVGGVVNDGGTLFLDLRCPIVSWVTIDQMDIMNSAFEGK